MHRYFIGGLLALGLAGCTGAPGVTPPDTGPDLARELRFVPPIPDAGQCWHQDDRPALFETVTDQRLAPGSSAVMSESHQRELRPRRTAWFRTPCPPEVGDADYFQASLQRALKARGYYEGAITGRADALTAEALRRWQAAGGLDSAVLSRRGAVALGLLVH